MINTLIISMDMRFQKPNTREGIEKYLPITRGENLILISLRPTDCFLVNPKVTFIITYGVKFGDP